MSFLSIRHLRLACVFLVTAVLFGFEARAQPVLKLFPGTFLEIVDQGPNDQNPLVGTIGRVQPWDVPMFPDPSTIPSGLTFTGEVIGNFIGPTGTTAASASITITNAVLLNPTNSFVTIDSHPSAPIDYPNMLQFASLEHASLNRPGSISVGIRGRLRGRLGNRNPAPWNVDPQQLHLGASDTSFIGTPDMFAYANAVTPTPQNVSAPPVRLSASGSTSGFFPNASGILQLHIDDALVLGPRDRLILPTSIEVFAGDFPAVIPEPSAMALLAIGVMLAATRGRKRR